VRAARHRRRRGAALEALAERRAQVGEGGEVVDVSTAANRATLIRKAGEEAARLETTGRGTPWPSIPRRAACAARPRCRQVAPRAEVGVTRGLPAFRPARPELDLLEKAIFRDVVFEIAAQRVEFALVAGDAVEQEPVLALQLRFRSKVRLLCGGLMRSWP